MASEATEGLIIAIITKGGVIWRGGAGKVRARAGGWRPCVESGFREVVAARAVGLESVFRACQRESWVLSSRKWPRGVRS